VIVLRSHQWVALEEASRDRFARKAILHLREHMADGVAGLTDRQLHVRLSEAINRAARFGFQTEFQVICFLDAEILAGTGFYESEGNPWAWRVLTNPSLTASDRARLLLLFAVAYTNSTERSAI
jgi:hypothetical protein